MQSIPYWHCCCTYLTCWNPCPAVELHLWFQVHNCGFTVFTWPYVSRHNFAGMQQVIDPTSTISAPGLLLGGLWTGSCWLVTTILPYRCKTLLTCTDAALPAGRAATLLVMSVCPHHSLPLCILRLPSNGLKHACGYLAPLLLWLSARLPAGETHCIA